jgi:hypothetical protein
MISERRPKRATRAEPFRIPIGTRLSRRQVDLPVLPIQVVLDGSLDFRAVRYLLGRVLEPREV